MHEKNRFKINYLGANENAFTICFQASWAFGTRWGSCCNAGGCCASGTATSLPRSPGPRINSQDQHPALVCWLQTHRAGTRLAAWPNRRSEFSGPTTIQPSLQALAVLFPPGCSSSLLSFLQLLLLEWALESPNFAELLKVVTENPASNLFQYGFSNSSSWGIQTKGLGLFLHHCLTENQVRMKIGTALIPTNGMTDKATRH